LGYTLFVTKTLTQTGLINRIIEAAGVTQLPIKHTPASAKPLVKDEPGDDINGTFNYISVVGMLQYLQNHTRPDITYAVSQCARFVHHPKRSHEEAVIHLCQYICGTPHRGLIYRPTGGLYIDAYVDTDFAGLWPHEDHLDPTSVKSCSGWVVKVAGCPVFWGSRLQSLIVLSAMEAEYNALITIMREIIPFKELVQAVGKIVGFTDVEVTTMKTTVWEDNVGALTLANLEPGCGTPRSKHYGTKMHWFCSKLVPNNIVIEQISTKEQQADIMTKGLTKDIFAICRFKLSGW
jgi:hypothetical protein